MSKTIGTHSGTFHCDEALACYMLKLMPEYKDATIVRSRDASVLDKCDIIVDVGATYEPDKKRFDHHQRGFNETFSPNHKIKLSSAGLVYKHYGKEIIKVLVNTSADHTSLIFQKVYKQLIEGIDGIDNGVLQYPEEVKAAYSIRTDLSARVGRLNPAWNEEGVDIDERFKSAMSMTGAEFEQAVKYLANAWLPARAIVAEALAEAKTVHESGEIIALKQYTVWKSHLDDLEVEQDCVDKTKYVLYQDSSKAWRVQAVAVGDSFVSRLPLPEPWRGIRDEALSKLSGIPDCIFVHAGGFIGGNKTYEGALAMAKASLAMHANKKQKV